MIKMPDQTDLAERVSAIEARCSVITPRLNERVEKIEEKTDRILEEVIGIKSLMAKNANQKTVKISKMEQKISRFVTGAIIAFATIALAVVAVVVAFYK